MFRLKNSKTNKYLISYHQGNLLWSDDIEESLTMSKGDADRFSKALKRGGFHVNLEMEQVGTTVELPCKVGDKAYIPHQDKVETHIIDHFYIDKFTTKINIGTHYIDIKLLGKTWFLSEKEAENALSAVSMTPSSVFGKQ